MAKEQLQTIAPKSADDLTALFPDLCAQIRQQGADSVDTVVIIGEAAAGERDRILGLARIHFGEESAGKFEKIITTNVTVEQYKAIRAEPVVSEEQKAIDAAKDAALAAIQKTGADNPGAGGGGDEKDFMAVVEEVMTVKKIGKTQAMSLVVRSHPKLHQAYIKKCNQGDAA